MRLSATTPRMISFDPDEINDIEFAQLVLMGVPPHSIPVLTIQQKAMLFAVHNLQSNPPKQ